MVTLQPRARVLFLGFASALAIFTSGITTIASEKLLVLLETKKNQAIHAPNTSKYLNQLNESEHRLVQKRYQRLDEFVDLVHAGQLVVKVTY